MSLPPYPTYTDRKTPPPQPTSDLQCTPLKNKKIKKTPYIHTYVPTYVHMYVQLRTPNTQYLLPSFLPIKRETKIKNKKKENRQPSTTKNLLYGNLTKYKPTYNTLQYIATSPTKEAGEGEEEVNSQPRRPPVQEGGKKREKKGKKTLHHRL